MAYYDMKRLRRHKYKVRYRKRVRCVLLCISAHPCPCICVLCVVYLNTKVDLAYVDIVKRYKVCLVYHETKYSMHECLIAVTNGDSGCGSRKTPIRVVVDCCILKSLN